MSTREVSVALIGMMAIGPAAPMLRANPVAPPTLVLHVPNSHSRLGLMRAAVSGRTVNVPLFEPSQGRQARALVASRCEALRAEVLPFPVIARVP